MPSDPPAASRPPAALEVTPAREGPPLKLPRKPIDRRFVVTLLAATVVVGGGAAALATMRQRSLLAQHESNLRYLRAHVRPAETPALEDTSEGGTGGRHAGPEGRMGRRDTPSRNARYSIRSQGQPPHLSRAAASDAVSSRGVFAALGAPGGGLAGGSSGVVSPFGGMGTGGGGAGEGTLGLGNIGTMGHGAGTGSGQGYGSGAGRGLRSRGVARVPTVRGGSGANGLQGFVPPPTPAVVLDPNGRFATTYRPGRGHLAWFDAAVARGEVPEATRELVADLGTQEVRGLTAPTEGALSYRVDLERGALSPSGGPLRLRLALRSASASSLGRPTMSVHLVVDTSGSMAGEAIANARAAARELVGRLADGDHFSLSAFESSARVVVTEGTVGGRRAQILRAIEGLAEGGGTNIEAGLALGYQMAARGPEAADANRIVMLLSDGEPTDGETGRDALAAMAARALQEGTETSSFGVGTSYDGALMSRIAEWGAGGYYYLPESARVAEALRSELERRARPVAQAVEVRVRLAPGVQLTQAYGSRRLGEAEGSVVRAQELALDRRTAARDHVAENRQRDREGGMRFFIPGFSGDDQHVLLLGLNVPAGVGERAIASVELRYKDRLTRRNVTAEQAVRARYAGSDAESVATLDRSVQATAQSFEAGESVLAASQAIGDGAPERASTLLAERASLLRTAAERLETPALSAEARRLERLRNLVAEPGRSPLLLAMLLDTSGRGMLH